MLFYSMSNHCEILRVTRHNHYLEVGNGSNNFGNHWSMQCNRNKNGNYNFFNKSQLTSIFYDLELAALKTTNTVN